MDTLARPPEGLVAHASIDKAIRALMASFDGGAAASELEARFHALSECLRNHLRDEERDIASFAEADPADATYLLREHASFRTMLDVLAERLHAGTLSLDDVRGLRTRVSFHEAHEETGLYRWISGQRAR